MEVKNLYPFVLIVILVGMVLGVGILVLENFGAAVKDSTDVVNESNTFIGAGVSTTTNDDVTAMTEISNGTVTCTTFNTAIACANWTKPGVMSLSHTTFTDWTANYNVSYTYDADTDAYTASADTVTAMAAISTTWLPLIVTIAILAIILVLVVRSFSGVR